MKRFSRRKLLAGLCTVPLAATVDALAIEPSRVRVSTLRLNEQPKHRFVHFSDLHHKGDAVFLRTVVEKINAQKPDFVCFTGDLIEDSSFAPEALQLLEEIEAPLYGIPGNHDYWADLDFDLPRESFSKRGGKWLMNEQLAIRDGAVHLFGMSGTEYAPFKPVPGSTNILLSHYPTGVDSFRDTKFDLVLAGHSHGGQVRLPWYGAVIVPFGVGEYQLGLYDTCAGPLYVSAGIGYFYANIRFCCPPEITVVEVSTGVRTRSVPAIVGSRDRQALTTS